MTIDQRNGGPHDDDDDKGVDGSPDDRGDLDNPIRPDHRGSPDDR